jgi:hypothetical protein
VFISQTPVWTQGRSRRYFLLVVCVCVIVGLVGLCVLFVVNVCFCVCRARPDVVARAHDAGHEDRDERRGGADHLVEGGVDVLQGQVA